MKEETRKYYLRRLSLSLEWLTILNEMLAKETDADERKRLTHLLGLEKELAKGLRHALNSDTESFVVL